MAMHLLIALHRHGAVDGLVLGMWCEHPVVTRVRVRLIMIDLDLLRRHALYALHCEGFVAWSRTMVYNSDSLLEGKTWSMIQW